MTVVYLYNYNNNINSGVTKKVLNQVIYLNENGLKCVLLLIGGDEQNIPDCIFIRHYPIRIKRIQHNHYIYGFIRQLVAFYCVKSMIETLNDDDILYLRYSPPLFVTPFDFMKKRKCKIIFEYNSIVRDEAKLGKSIFPYLRDIFFGRSFRKRTDAIIGVTDQITQSQLEYLGGKSMPHITIGNGINAGLLPQRNPPLFDEFTLNLLCVANVSLWHGLDRLLHGISIYLGTLNVILHIVGDGEELPHLQKLAGDLGISDQVVFHGFVTGEPLDALFDLCHIAVGSLGIHRKGLTQTSELKGREYCARGIPYIIACADPDFPADFPYILHIPADESPIDIDQIAAFTKKAFSDPDHSERMRHYAVEYLDWSVKMKKLKDFIEVLTSVASTI